MALTSNPRPTAGQFFLQATGITALVFAVCIAPTGCGGSGGDGNGNASPTPTPNTSAVVSGRVIESTTTQLISGAVVRFGDLTATTDSTGSFSFTVPGGTASRALTVQLPTGYYNYAYRNGACVEALSSAGITVNANDLETGDRTSVGDIRVFATNGPPPPPCNF